MLLALRSLFEPEVSTYIAPAGKIGRRRFAVIPVLPHRNGIAKLESLYLFPVVGKIEASGSAVTLFNSATAKVEIGILKVTASATATSKGQKHIQGQIGRIRIDARNDDDEAMMLILGNL